MIMRNKNDENLLLFTIVWPCILENMAATMVSLVDTAMVGSINAAATAAVGICTTPTWLLNGLFRSLGIGGTAIAARAVGAGDFRTAEHTAAQVFRVTLGFSALISLLLFFCSGVFPFIMRASAEVAPVASSYARILSCGFLLHYTGMCMGTLLRGAGDTKTPMFSGLIANCLNVTGNILLIYPTRDIHFFGISLRIWGAGLGVQGAAIASAVSMSLAGLYILLKMIQPGSRLRLSLHTEEKTDIPLLRRVFVIALPAALERVSINVGQILFASFISAIGTAELAAYHITTNIEALGYMPANGFQSAAAALCGQKLGAREPDAAQSLCRKAILYSIILLCGIGFLMFIYRDNLAGLFSSDPAVIAVTSQLLVLCALVQPFNAVTIVTAGALNGAGDTRMPFLFSLISMWTVRIVFSYLLGFLLGYGVCGVYFSMILDLAVRSVLLLFRFRSGKWKSRQV